MSRKTQQELMSSSRSDPKRRRSQLLALALVAAPLTAVAGVNDLIQAVRQSEFSFARVASDVPYYPLGWAQNHSYPRAQFENQGALPDAEVVENTFDLGAVLPAYVAPRDMLLLGGNLALDSHFVSSGPYPDQTVLQLVPVAAWLHQFGRNETVGVFAAPILSKDLQGNSPWGASGYAGLIAMHHFSDQFQLLYGGVYENSFGQSSGYPYLGVIWLPSPKWSVDLVFPWPTISYVPHERWLLQLGVAPGGSSWVQRGNNLETTQTFGSWNLTAGVGYRLQKSLWLFAGAGVAGLRGLKIQGGGDEANFDMKPSPVFTLALQFRP